MPSHEEVARGEDQDREGFGKMMLRKEVKGLKQELLETRRILARAVEDRDTMAATLKHAQEKGTDLEMERRALKRVALRIEKDDQDWLQRALDKVPDQYKVDPYEYVGQLLYETFERLCTKYDYEPVGKAWNELIFSKRQLWTGAVRYVMQVLWCRQNDCDVLPQLNPTRSVLTEDGLVDGKWRFKCDRCSNTFLSEPPLPDPCCPKCGVNEGTHLSYDGPMPKESEPHQVSPPSTYAEVMASDNMVIKEGMITVIIEELEEHIELQVESSEEEGFKIIPGLTDGARTVIKRILSTQRMMDTHDETLKKLVDDPTKKSSRTLRLE